MKRSLFIWELWETNIITIGAILGIGTDGAALAKLLPEHQAILFSTVMLIIIGCTKASDKLVMTYLSQPTPPLTNPPVSPTIPPTSSEPNKP